MNPYLYIEPLSRINTIPTYLVHRNQKASGSKMSDMSDGGNAGSTKNQVPKHGVHIEPLSENVRYN